MYDAGQIPRIALQGRRHARFRGLRLLPVCATSFGLREDVVPVSLGVSLGVALDGPDQVDHISWFVAMGTGIATRGFRCRNGCCSRWAVECRNHRDVIVHWDYDTVWRRTAIRGEVDVNPPYQTEEDPEAETKQEGAWKKGGVLLERWNLLAGLE